MSQQKDRFLAIVNPAAGGGKSAKLAGQKLAQLRDSDLHIDVTTTTDRGHALYLAAEAYAQGYRQFIAVGGGGTAHVIMKCLFRRTIPRDGIALWILSIR